MKTQEKPTQEHQSRSVANQIDFTKNGAFPTSEIVDSRPESIAQRKLQETADVHVEQQVAIQKKANNTGLPDNLKSGIENLSGYAMDDVKVHYNSAKPAQLNAHAYAQGTEIHMAPGQEKHLPHEAWHVVQQKQGRVKPTRQMKGKVNINDDEGLEKEADVMGAKALQLRGVLKSLVTTSTYSSEIFQRVVLKNVNITNNTYVSQVHNKTVYHMIVDPSVDSELSIQIEKAQAFAKVGANRNERLGLLFQYVDSLPKNEDGRNEIYEDSGRKDENQNSIREAYLGDCLNKAAACRELSAFLHLLMAEEGISTDFTVGAVGGTFNAQRHAWLQIPNNNDEVIDPTMTRVGLKPNIYHSQKNANMLEPVVEHQVNIDEMQTAAYKTEVRSFLGKLRGDPETLREKANASLASYETEHKMLLTRIKEWIDGSKVLSNLQKEGVFSFEVISEKPLDQLKNQVVPDLEAMSKWPENPGQDNWVPDTPNEFEKVPLLSDY